MTLIDAAVLGMYVPIVLVAAATCVLFGWRYFWRRYRTHGWRRLGDNAMALCGFCSLAAHAAENSFYGLARWSAGHDHLIDWLPGVGVWKGLILAACIFGATGIMRALQYDHEQPAPTWVSRAQAWARIRVRQQLVHRVVIRVLDIYEAHVIEGNAFALSTGAVLVLWAVSTVIAYLFAPL